MTKDEIWKKWEVFCWNEGYRPNTGTKNALLNSLESAGYSCDFDAADILAKIREHGGEATIRQLRDRTFKYRREGGTEALEQKLREIINAGFLTSRHETADNGREVEYFAIANAPDDSCANDS